MPSRGDMVVGNDVWCGLGRTVMPGRRIGDGADPAAVHRRRGGEPAPRRVMGLARRGGRPHHHGGHARRHRTRLRRAPACRDAMTIVAGGVSGPVRDRGACRQHIVGISKTAYVPATPRCLDWGHDLQRASTYSCPPHSIAGVVVLLLGCPENRDHGVWMRVGRGPLVPRDGSALWGCADSRRGRGIRSQC